MSDRLVCDDCGDPLKADTMSLADPSRCKDCVEDDQKEDTDE